MKLSFPLAAAFAAILSLTACGGGGGDGGSTMVGESANLGGKIKIVSDSAGTGTAATVTGNRVQVNYTGWLYSATAANNKGKQFDSNMVAGGKPLLFKIDGTTPPESVLTGFNQAVLGMKVGGKRTVLIPASLAYGPAGIPGTIPSNADLVFDVELTKICVSSEVGKDC